MYHAEQFDMPSGITPNSLRNGPAALLEAACAVACHFASGDRAFLQSFLPGFRSRAERAFSVASPSPLAHIQAHALLASLSLLRGGTGLDGQRHAGAAWQLSVSARLHLLEGQAAASNREAVETWWMVYRLDRAWSIVLNIPPAQPGDTAIRTPFFPRTVRPSIPVIHLATHAWQGSMSPPPHLLLLPNVSQAAFDPTRETASSYLSKVISIATASHRLREAGNIGMVP
jgi:hypothetical protein